jgi:hypothetical protein
VKTVTATVSDADGSSVATDTVTVNNVAPSALLLSAPADVGVNQSFSFSGSFTDPGTLDTHNVTIDWGDGTNNTLNPALGDRTFSTTHTYASANTYVVSVTVKDDDTGSVTNTATVVAKPPVVSIGDVAETEGDAGVKLFTFTVSRSFDGGISAVDWATTDGVTPGAIANAGPDYVAASGTAVFAPGELSTTLNVTVNGDVNVESDQGFLVNLSNPLNATIADGQGIGMILNDDSNVPVIRINDVAISEGDSGTKNISFKVALDKKINQAVKVNYATSANTATAGSDFVARSGTLTIPTFATSATITIQVKGDTTIEPDETFFIKLSTPVNATIGDNSGVGTILNNDTNRTIRISDAPSVVEGNTGTRQLIFTVTLDQASSSTVSVKFATADGTAKLALNDYKAASGTLTFSPGQTSKQIIVTTVGDTRKGIDETVFVNLTSPLGATIADGQGVGKILNDD